MITDIETYLNSLSDDILTLDISYKGITYLPDLTRFVKLEKLDCFNNQLTSLPTLPENLKVLFCDMNQLTLLPDLTRFTNLETLACSYNQLTSLPSLPQNIQAIYCCDNQLSSLPSLPENLKALSCYKNKLTSLPTLPQNLEIFCCHNNPIYNIIINNNDNNSLIKTKQNIQIVNNFRHLYYCLQLKTQFRKWLWERVRETNTQKMYHPNNLIKLIEQLDDNDSNDDSLNEVLDNWK